MMTITPKPTQLNLDGILLLDKATGITSNTALQRIKRLLRAKKAGHCGCLDPLATGMLPICLGEAVKYSQYLIDADKTYEVTLQLGVTTTTGDSEGEVIATKPLPATLSGSLLEQIIQPFLGQIQQTPPMYSALKYQGKPLYEYARAGVTVPRKARAISIYDCQLLGWTQATMRLRVHCSKGTYIRTLVEDIGAALGCGAHVTQLRRVAITGLPEAQMITEAALAQMDAALQVQRLLPVTLAVQRLQTVQLSEALAQRFRMGQKLPDFVAECGVVAVYKEGGDFLGVGEISAEAVLKPKRLLAGGDQARSN